MARCAAVPIKAVLVPTAERDPAIGLAIFRPTFAACARSMYNSHEERAMIHAAAGNEAVPGRGGRDRVGDSRAAARERFRQKFDIRRPFAIYVGRIDENKGCKELFDFFLRYAATFPRGLDLVLVGSAIMPFPQHPRIHHLGFLTTRTSSTRMAASDVLIMPSYFESLSMVALEAWALGRPVLANGRCDVLKGQCIRSAAGLYYETVRGVRRDAVRARVQRPLQRALGRNGRGYFERHYAWPVIERKYLDMFDRLSTRDAGRRGRRWSRCPAGSPAPRGRARGRRGARRIPSGAVIARRVSPACPVRMTPERRRAARPPGARHLGYGDAIGHEVLGIQRVLRAAGYDSEIFVETADPGSSADRRLP